MDWTSEYLGGRLGLNQPVNTSLKPGQEKWVVVSSWCFAFGTSGGPSGARRTLWSCGSVPSACELCSLINYALAANEIERVELPLQLSVSDGERSLCPGTGSTPGLGRDAALTQARVGSQSGWGVVNQAPCFASHRLCNTGQLAMTCRNICQIALFRCNQLSQWNFQVGL